MNKVQFIASCTVYNTFIFFFASVFQADVITTKVGAPHIHYLAPWRSVKPIIERYRVNAHRRAEQKGYHKGKVWACSRWPCIKLAAICKRSVSWADSSRKVDVVFGAGTSVSRVNPCCLSLKSSIASFSTQYSMKVKSRRKTFSTLAQRQTNKQFLLWITWDGRAGSWSVKF